MKGSEAAGHGGHTPWPAWRQPVTWGLAAVMGILPLMKEHCMADDTVQAELERLRAENAALKARATKAVTLKVSDAISKLKKCQEGRNFHGRKRTVADEIHAALR